MNKNQEYWNILNNITDWVKYSDTKATIILTLYGVILTVIYSNSVQVLSALKSSETVFWFTICSSIMGTLSILFSFLCINPRLKNENAKSIIYFGHIQEKFSNAADYFTKSEQILSNEDEYNSELAEQIHVNSNVAWKKFSKVTWSVRFLFGSLVFISLSLVTYLI